ncbi:MAG TPA: hypothetical protein VK915_00105 [Gaiellaceae bacterium]|nr:hypothetical protein [Gaiellaceae bacterium]
MIATMPPSSIRRTPSGVLERTEHPVAAEPQLAAVALADVGECGKVARPHGGDGVTRGNLAHDLHGSL